MRPCGIRARASLKSGLSRSCYLINSDMVFGEHKGRKWPVTRKVETPHAYLIGLAEVLSLAGSRISRLLRHPRRAKYRYQSFVGIAGDRAVSLNGSNTVGCRSCSPGRTWGANRSRGAGWSYCSDVSFVAFWTGIAGSPLRPLRPACPCLLIWARRVLSLAGSRISRLLRHPRRAKYRYQSFVGIAGDRAVSLNGSNTLGAGAAAPAGPGGPIVPAGPAGPIAPTSPVSPFAPGSPGSP